MKIKHVHTKRAKGRTYLYFDTGTKKPNGSPILTPLPATDDPNFGRKLADAQRARTMRQKPAETAMTIRRLADLYERSDKFRALAKGTQNLYAIYLAVIRDQIGPAVADEFQRHHAQLLLDSLAAKPGAANMTIRTLGAVYQWGRKRGHTAGNPTAEVEMLAIGEHEPWPEQLLQDALASDDALVRNAVALLYFTAQRIGDVARMTWTAFAGGRVKVKAQKNGADLDFAQTPELAAILATIPKRGLTILCQPNGRAYAPETIRRYIQAWAAAKGHKIVPHGLRKNAVNALLHAGCSAAEAQAISGQSLAVLEHYAKRRDRSKLGDAAVLKWGRNV